MKILIVSDVHNKLSKVQLIPADLLIIAGDLTNNGTTSEFIGFNSDVGKIKDMYKHGVLAIPGNHDLGAEEDFNFVKSILNNVTYFIHHEKIVIDGISFFGSAYTPFFFDWAYNVHRGAAIRAKWDQIPEKLDVLITHGPVAGIHDINSRGEAMGCKDLLDAVLRIKPKIHICGHNHNGYGVKKLHGITFINASSCNEKYLPINAPISIEI